MNLQAKYKIKRDILRLVEASEPEEFKFGSLETPEEIETAYSQITEVEINREFEEDYRSGDVETNIPSEYSRHYESRSVARQIDGEWVGWTYWYGGGKYGEPEAIEWIEDAYDLDCHEEQKTVTVRTFKKKENTEGL